MKKEKILERAKNKLKHIHKLRQDPRYLKTLGKLKREGFLDVRDVPEYRGQVFLEEALWAAKLEPRVYELLPAIIARRPRFFVFFNLPEDLKTAVREINGGNAKTPYQGVSPEKVNQWVLFVARKSMPVKVMKAFRLLQEDLEILRRLSEKADRSQAQIIHQALIEYDNKLD